MPREVGLWFEIEIVFGYAALSCFFRRHLELGQPSRTHLELFTQVSTGQLFLRKNRVLYINLWLIYHRFSKNYLFYLCHYINLQQTKMLLKRMRARLAGTHVQLDGKCIKLFSQACVAQSFQVNIGYYT